MILNRMNGENTLQTQCTESESHSQRCLNPLCGNPVEPKRKHAPVKRYCSADCRQAASIIKRAAALLKDLPDQAMIEIVRSN